MTTMETCSVAIEQPLQDMPSGSLSNWLATLEGDYNTLLVHQYSGVIWGTKVFDKWEVSSGLIDNSPTLDLDRVLHLRVFGQTSEIYVWRTAVGLQGRKVSDSEVGTTDCFDEQQVLWGTEFVRQTDGFTVVREGDRGMQHAVPLVLSKSVFETDSDKKTHPLRLRVRHYVQQDDQTGLAQIFASRLVNVQEEKKNGS